MLLSNGCWNWNLDKVERSIQYFDVPAEEHTAFLAADSKGTYLNLQFKPRQYRYHRVWPQEK
jgi:hypothetical protein